MLAVLYILHVLLCLLPKTYTQLVLFVLSSLCMLLMLCMLPTLCMLLMLCMPKGAIMLCGHGLTHDIYCGSVPFCM